MKLESKWIGILYLKYYVNKDIRVNIFIKIIIIIII